MRTAIGKGHVSLNLTIRRTFGLYANVRPAKTVPGVKTPYSEEGVDCVIMRENTEGEYSGIEHTVSNFNILHNQDVILAKYHVYIFPMF